MKTIRIILVVIAFVNFLSCSDDFLEPVPTAVLVGDTYPNNSTELEAVLVAVYDALQGVNSLEISDNTRNHAQQIEFYVTEMLSDNTRSKSGEGEAGQFDNFRVVTTNGFVFDYYRSMYDIIYKANLVLDNLDVAGNDVERIEGEAKFMRALAYFNLVRSFGDVPLVDKPLELSDVETQFTRIATNEVYNLIIEDLEYAARTLDATSNPNRASLAAAQGILAKVFLTVGNYSDAQVLLENIINSENYSLEDNFRDVFYNEENSETIFSVGYVPGSSQDSQNFSAEMLNGVGRTSGVNYVTDDAIAALDEYGGARTQYSKRVDPTQTTQTQVVKWLPNGDTNLGIPETSSDPTSAGNDWIVLRYADVLLMHAEAIMAGASQTSSSNALESFQKVRDRAGLTDEVTEITREELLIERRVELAFENHRIHDLRRFGVAQQVLSAYADVNGLNFNATDLLLPLPQFEINLSNGLLEQNPGY